MEAISADGLRKSYGGVTILDGATLTLEEGHRAVIYGPTGCGKTTLLYILAGLARSESGKVRLFGAPASGNGVFLQPEERGLGVVFQKAVLWPHMTAAQNVEFALYALRLPRSERKRRAMETLECFGAADLAMRRPETLSGGQAQRIALARSIAARPRLLLWDEPFTGLDCTSRDAAARAAREYMERTNTTLLAVSHHREDAEALGAAVVLLKEGRLEAQS